MIYMYVINAHYLSHNWTKNRYKEQMISYNIAYDSADLPATGQPPEETLPNVL